MGLRRNWGDPEIQSISHCISRSPRLLITGPKDNSLTFTRQALDFTELLIFTEGNSWSWAYLANVMATQLWTTASNDQGAQKKKIGDTMLYFLVKDSQSPSPLPHLPKKAITDQSACGPDCTGCAMCVSSSYFSSHHLHFYHHLLWILHFCICHCKTSPQSAFQTGPGMINDTVTHLLVSFNHFKTSGKCFFAVIWSYLCSLCGAYRFI